MDLFFLAMDLVFFLVGGGVGFGMDEVVSDGFNFSFCFGVAWDLGCVATVSVGCGTVGVGSVGGGIGTF